MFNSFNFKYTLLSKAIKQSLIEDNLLSGKISMKENKTSNLVEEDNESSLTHNQVLLNKARQVIQLLAETAELPETRPVMQRRLFVYKDRLEDSLKLLLKRDYKIVVIGSIGAGKSTAICELAGLTIPNTRDKSVLETGAGGTTICEVHLLTGSEYQIKIEPCTDDELRDHVKDFSDYLLAVTATKTEDANNDSQGISKEVDRALRNMSGLGVRKEKQDDGKTIVIDDAKELAKQFTSVRELSIKVMELMELHKRDRKNLYFDSCTSKEPFEWLKNTFASINNGRHPDFTLPKRIEIIVPFSLLDHNECSSVRIIDTKGVDRTVARHDLECHLGDSHTLTVLCSPFKNAPAAEPELILKRAKAVGIQSLSLNTVLLVLPRHEEALAIKDDSGKYADSVEEGYELKFEQVKTALAPLDLQELPIYFFNSREDDASKLRNFLNSRLTAMRENLRQQLNDTIQDAKNTLANYEQEQFQAVQLHVGQMIQSWINQNRHIAASNRHIQDELIEAMQNVYPKTIYATVKRKGNWDNLKYCYLLGRGTISFSMALIGEKVSGFDTHCRILMGNPEFVEAKELINQAKDMLVVAFSQLKDQIRLKGEELFTIELEHFATELWFNCEQEWGKGSGYCDRVIRHNRLWFDNTRLMQLEQNIYSLIEHEWQLSLDKVNSLLETE